MKNKILIFLFFFLLFQGCLLYDNTTSWEDTAKIRHYDMRDADTSKFHFRMELEKARRLFIIPFLICEVDKRKPLYRPVIGITSRDQTITNFFDFRIELFTLDSISFFKHSYPDTIPLNVFNDLGYNATLHYFNIDTIQLPREIKDSIMIDYHLKITDVSGKISIIEGSGVQYVQTHYKKFGSFF